MGSSGVLFTSELNVIHNIKIHWIFFSSIIFRCVLFFVCSSVLFEKIACSNVRSLSGIHLYAHVSIISPRLEPNILRAAHLLLRIAFASIDSTVLGWGDGRLCVVSFFFFYSAVLRPLIG